MVEFPRDITNPIELANNAIEGVGRNIPGFDSAAAPSKSGFAVRQSRIPSERPGRFTRNLVRWFVPETGIVEMYINPQNISYQDKKHITQQRTKGGYTLQYWGEELGQLSINGTTGSSGVEGINVLYDIYRNEQVSFDPYALAIAAAIDAKNSEIGDITPLSLFVGGPGLGQSVSDQFFDAVNNTIETGSANSSRPRPTLASLAFSVEMYWSGWVFRGYFTDFKVDEKSSQIGLFDYSMTFVYTQRRGVRNNFFAWHRSSTNGPSNSDSTFGPPYSFKSTVNDTTNPPRQSSTAPTPDQALTSDAGLILKPEVFP